MQDIIARALALRNNGSSSGASAELEQKVQKIEDEYVRATDEKDIEEISSSIEAIKQEIEDKGAEVKASLDSNSAIKAIQPLSEIVNYGAKYTYETASWGNSELVKVTADTKANNIIFVTEEDSTIITFQFWDVNGRQSVYGGACNGRNLVTVFNDGSQITVFISSFGGKTFRYNSDKTFKNLYDGTFAQTGSILTRSNTTEYTPTKDYHPATKKYVDDAIPTSLKNPFPLTFTGAVSAVYDGSAAVTVDLPSGSAACEEWELLIDEKDVEITETVQAIVLSLPSNKRLKKVRLYMVLNRSNTDPITITRIGINNVYVNLLMYSNRDKNIHMVLSAENDGFGFVLTSRTSVSLRSNTVGAQIMLTAAFNRDCDGKINIPASFAGKYTIEAYGVYE